VIEAELVAQFELVPELLVTLMRRHSGLGPDVGEVGEFHGIPKILNRAVPVEGLQQFNTFIHLSRHTVLLNSKAYFTTVPPISIALATVGTSRYGQWRTERSLVKPSPLSRAESSFAPSPLSRQALGTPADR